MPQIVVLLCRPTAEGRMEPVGTGFLVCVPAEGIAAMHFYVVTARHIASQSSDLHARIRLHDGIVDVSLPDWVMSDSPAEDVAITAFPYMRNWQQKCWRAEHFLSERDEVPYLGDNVYFMGLLKFVPEMAEQNIPMVRSGTLGAMNQVGIPVQMPDNVVVKMKGHLIDCRAYRGFSGSPCFVQDPNGTTRMLGVISAHLDASAAVPLRGDLIEGASAQIPIHAGVGVVAPVELLRDLLDDASLVEMRKKAEEAMLKAEQDEVKPASADSAEIEPGEFERFEDLTRKLTQVPKAEIDERRKDES